MHKKRCLGLDMVRSIAIISVLISHSQLFFQNTNLKFLSILGILGVEMFFVLSGYLIGNIIIKDFVEASGKPSLPNFYIRRWLRTLPLYYLVLLLNSIVTGTHIPISNFVFMQNFNATDLNFLPVSWSLSVEEWFYLIVPLILFIGLKRFGQNNNKQVIFFSVAITILLLSLILRAYTVYTYNPAWDYGIRKQVFLRMDSIMIGVLLSGIKRYHINFYNKVAYSKVPFVITVLGFAIIGIIYITILGSGLSFNSETAKIWFLTVPLLYVCFLLYGLRMIKL